MEFANKELIIITGVSGAGKSSAMGFLEDVGYYCIDKYASGAAAHLYRLDCQSGGVS